MSFLLSTRVLPFQGFRPASIRCRLALGGLLAVGVLSHFAAAQNPDNTLASATASIRAQRYGEAIATLEQARPAHRDDPRLPTAEGIAYSLQGDDNRALACFRAALKIRPGFPHALQAEASILSRRHDPAVVPLLREILRSSPDDPTAHEMLALAEAQTGDCSASLRDFAAAGPSVSTHPDSLEHKGACLLDEKAYPEAIAAFGQLRSLQPGSASAAYDLALAQFDAGDTHAATETLAPLLANTPDIDTLLLAADASEQGGDTPKAAALLRQAIVADPTRGNSYVRFAELCMAHESYQTGVDMVSVGLVRQPRDPGLFLARGLLYGGMAKYDLAEADFRSAEQLDPQHGTGAYGVGLVEAQRNNPDAALRTTRLALRSHPEDAQLHVLLARLLLEGGAQPGSPLFGEATTSAQDAVRLRPNLVAGHDLLARIYGETGKPALSAAECRAALALDPDDTNALYRLMRALHATGDDKAAQVVGREVAAQHQRAREGETGRLRYRIEEGPATRPDGDPGATGTTPKR